MAKGLIPEVENPAVTVKLREPIKLLDDLLTEVKLREPRGIDMIQNGNPVKFNGFSEEYQVAFDEVAVVKMLCALSNGLPRIAFERMNTNDLSDCCWAIAPFFIPWVNRKEESPKAPDDGDLN
ncbi:hypothetical protein D3273_25270 [Lichenibacterium minor]|uniref:Phage tail assembly protein n=1 Tax=Lichenibacterium minor TaxID=2316528 RepID=A0A4Q2U0L3_9HYPH|nr:phage tail assembly protein [Lichenibacterium minor]RYC29178.1 hypothetical protein D3273_25270 [Lichenibacterium minor]